VATRMFDRRPVGVNDPQARAAAIVERHGARLLSIARQWSLCTDDAQDAFQRALEIYLRRADSLEPETELAWLKVVTDSNAPRRARRRRQVGLNQNRRSVRIRASRAPLRSAGFDEAPQPAVRRLHPPGAWPGRSQSSNSLASDGSAACGSRARRPDPRSIIEP
jgi:DNA-directed RNA polymerase specialized sigma24 family protein